MEKQSLNQAQFIFYILTGVFIAVLVACNLIFQKFFSWNPFGLYNFEISVGLLPYPITFLVTDLISEIYGKQRANQVVKVGLISTVFVMGVIVLAEQVNATNWSPVSNAEFSKVFGLTGAAVAASMIAYLLAQFIDIKIYHFWKKLTQGKHLWLRNNFSTITSQFVDTSVVLLILCSFKAISWSLYGTLLFSGFLFKVLVALVDTPLLYVSVFLLRKKFNLKINEEINW